MFRWRMFEAANIDDAEMLFNKQPPPTDPMVLAMADEMDVRKREVFIKEVEMVSKIEERMAKSLNLIADAESKEAGQQIQEYTGILKVLNERIKIETQGQQQETQPDVDQGTIWRMAFIAINAGFL